MQWIDLCELALEPTQQINIISLGKIDVLCLAKGVSGVTRSIPLLLSLVPYQCLPIQGTTILVLDTFYSSKIPKKAPVLCTDIVRHIVKSNFLHLLFSSQKSIIWINPWQLKTKRKHQSFLKDLFSVLTFALWRFGTGLWTITN